MINGFQYYKNVTKYECIANDKYIKDLKEGNYLKIYNIVLQKFIRGQNF